MSNDYSPERCEWHERKMEAIEERLKKTEDSLYTNNGEPGLIEAVRSIARIQRWHTIALIALLLLQLNQETKEFFSFLLKGLLK